MIVEEAPKRLIREAVLPAEWTQAWLSEELPDTEVWFREPLSRHTSFRIGGPADLLLMPRTVADLQRIVRMVHRAGVPFTVIGNGSNLLVRDGGLRGVVLKVAENLAAVEFRGTLGYAQAGALLAVVSRLGAQSGLCGLEFACGIPGTIGGGVMMNAGAYGGEMKDVVTHVTVVDEQGELRRLSAPELEFGYRRSLLQSRPWIVADLEMELRPLVRKDGHRAGPVRSCRRGAGGSGRSRDGGVTRTAHLLHQLEQGASDLGDGEGNAVHGPFSRSGTGDFTLQAVGDAQDAGGRVLAAALLVGNPVVEVLEVDAVAPVHDPEEVNGDGPRESGGASDQPPEPDVLWHEPVLSRLHPGSTCHPGWSPAAELRPLRPRPPVAAGNHC